MERQRNAVRRRDFVIPAALAVATAVGVKGGAANGETPVVWAPVPQREFHNIDLNADTKRLKITATTPSGPLSVIFDNSPGPRLAGFDRNPSSSSPTTIFEARRQQIAEINSNTPLDNILFALKNSPQILNDVSNAQLRKDIRIYYPIIKPISDEFGLPWQLMMVTIEEESHASRSKTAFSKAKYPIQGIAQINVETWSSVIRETAKRFRGFENFPQRHPNDWNMIAAGIEIIYKDYKQYRTQGLSSYDSMLNAVSLYTGSESIAIYRMDQTAKLERVTPGT